MTFEDLATALRRFWGLALAVFMVTMVAGAIVALAPAERYGSTVTLLLAPTSEEDFDFGAQQAVEFLVPPTVTRIGLPAFDATVRAQLSTGRDALVEITAENEPGTGVINLEAVATDPETAEDAARIAAEEVVEDPISDLVASTVLNPPTDAESISGSRRSVILLGSGALGLIAALLAVTAAHQLRPRAASARLIKERVGLEVIGTIPHRRKLPYQSLTAGNGQAPHTIDDAFQKLAVTLEVLIKENAMVAITSWAQGEGKTLVTGRLASALASLGRPPLVVDCDLRHPSLHLSFDANPNRGVANIGEGDPPEQYVQSTPLAGLDLIAAGHTKQSVHQPLQTSAAALSAIRKAFPERLILIDTPPLFAAEASMIATMADAVVLIIDAQATQPVEMREAVRDLKLSDAQVVGAVLNRTRASERRTGYYYGGLHRTRR